MGTDKIKKERKDKESSTEIARKYTINKEIQNMMKDNKVDPPEQPQWKSKEEPHQYNPQDQIETYLPKNKLMKIGPQTKTTVLSPSMLPKEPTSILVS